MENPNMSNALIMVEQGIAEPLSKREALILTHAGHAAAFDAVCGNIRNMLENPPEAFAEVALNALGLIERAEKRVSAKVSGLIRIPEAVTPEGIAKAEEAALKRAEKAKEQGKQAKGFDANVWSQKRERAIANARTQAEFETSVMRYRVLRNIAGLTVQECTRTLREARAKKTPDQRQWLTALVAGSADLAGSVEAGQ